MSVLSRLLRSPEGAIGLALLSLLALMAIFAGVISPDDPLSIVGPALG